MSHPRSDALMIDLLTLVSEYTLMDQFSQYPGFFKHVTLDCMEWLNTEFGYPNYVTDVIVFSQCKSGHQETVDKVPF